MGYLDPILDQRHKDCVLKMAKVALGNKVELFGISCKLLTKDSICGKSFFKLISATFEREITEPLRKIKMIINNL